MKDLQLGRAFRLLWKTLPFLAIRCAVYFGSAILYLAIVIGCIWAGSSINGDVGPFWGFLIGLGIAGACSYFLREYLLYIVKAGHIAVLVELVDGRPLPEGRGQLAYAKDRVAETFVQASVFFAVDQTIKGVLGAISGLFQGVLAVIPGLGGASGFVDRLLRVSLGFVDEVILALSYRTRSTNPWQTSKQGLILYAQNYKRILKSAFFLCFVYYGLLVPFFFIAWMSTSALTSLLPDGSWLFAFIAALLFTWSLKKAFIEPLLMTAIMQLYFKCIEGQVPNPEWEAKLDRLSASFRGLADQSRSFGGADGLPEPAQQGPYSQEPQYAQQEHQPQYAAQYAPQAHYAQQAHQPQYAAQYAQQAHYAQQEQYAQPPQYAQHAPTPQPVPAHRPAARPAVGAITLLAASPPAPGTSGNH